MSLIKENENYNIEDIFQEYSLSDEEFGELINFLYEENIPEIKVSVEGNDFFIFDEENMDITESDTIKLYMEDIKNHVIQEEEKYEIEDASDRDQLVNKHLGIAALQTIKYLKIGFSFLDTVQEGALGLIRGIDLLKNSKIDTQFWLSNFVIKYILEYQKKFLSNFKAPELAYLLYLRVEQELENGLPIEEISRALNVEQEYLEGLVEFFRKIGTEPEKIYSITERISKITQKYVLGNIPKKLNFLEEMVLIMSYGLEGKVYRNSEIAKELNVSKSNVDMIKDKAIKKLAFNINSREVFESLEYLN